MNNDIELWFLLVSLVLPRIALIVGYISNGIPYNTVPFAADIVMAFFIPRILILLYIHTNQGFSTWFWIHGVVALLVYCWYGLRNISQSKS